MPEPYLDIPDTLRDAADQYETRDWALAIALVEEALERLVFEVRGQRVTIRYEESRT